MEIPKKIQSKIESLPVIEYTSVPVAEGRTKVSPSSLATFRRDPHEWRNGSSFKGNLSATIGTCVHALFEYTCVLMKEGYTADRIRELIPSIIEIKIDPYLIEQAKEEVITPEDVEEISRDMQSKYFDGIIDYCETKFFSGDVVIENEVQLLRDLKGSTLTVAGSTDAIVKYPTEKHIVDFKWTKRAISSITPYVPQLMSYAYMAKGITHITIVNISWTKTKGLSIKELTEEVTDKYKNIFKGLLSEIADTVEAADKHPELERLLFRKGVNFMGKIIL